MIKPSTEASTVLIVDDDAPFVTLCAERLGGEYAIRTATSASEGLGELDADVDAVLLDRALSGDDGAGTLASIRARESTHRVAMVTGVEPDADVLPMGYDDYVRRPTDGAELHATVETLLRLDTYDDALREYYRLAQETASHRTRASEDEGVVSEGAAALAERRDALGRELDDLRIATGSDELLALLDRDDATGERARSNE